MEVIVEGLGEGIEEGIVAGIAEVNVGVVAEGVVEGIAGTYEIVDNYQIFARCSACNQLATKVAFF